MVGRVEALLEEAQREGDGDVAGAEVSAGLWARGGGWSSLKREAAELINESLVFPT